MLPLLSMYQSNEKITSSEIIYNSCIVGFGDACDGH